MNYLSDNKHSETSFSLDFDGLSGMGNTAFTECCKQNLWSNFKPKLNCTIPTFEGKPSLDCVWKSLKKWFEINKCQFGLDSKITFINH